METSSQISQRNTSIDVLRGFVMLIMALDHVRDFFHFTAMTDDPLNLATTTPALFFTRWITHLCAPVFVFISGCSAYLAGKQKTTKELSTYLIFRGALLLVLELTVITFGWTFDLHYRLFILQVIWAIGFSMIILGLLVLTSYQTIVATAIIIFVGHNIFDFITPPADYTWKLLLNLLLITTERVFPINESQSLFIVYAALPWTGIMLLGYSYGIVFERSYSFIKRKKVLVVSAIGFIILFLILRFTNGYGDPGAWNTQRNATLTFLDFMDVNKYPPSLMYSLITIGLAMVLLACIEGRKGKVAKIIEVYGRVPFFYYLLHIYLIHILTVIVFYFEGYSKEDIRDPNSIFLFRPATFGYSLPTVYLIWVFVILLLYIPCKWFSEYRKTHREWWLKYL